MLSPLVNALAIVVGTFIGLILKRGIPKRLSDSVMKALGLCTLYIGVTGAFKAENPLLLILSMVFGTLIGEGVDLDMRLGRLGDWLEGRFKNGEGLAEGFVTATLLFCVGAMAIVGSLQSGLTGDHGTIYAKSILDFTAAIVFASSLGIGVAFSAVAVLVYQGSIVLLAGFIAPFLTDGLIGEMTGIGSLIIVALAFNMLGVGKFKVMNFVPAIFMPLVLYWFF